MVDAGKAVGRYISMAVDSGACDSVIDPEDVPEYPPVETKASIGGLAYASATGDEIPNLGEIKLPFSTREGTLRGMTVQAAPVAKPLGSVMRICQAGHMVVFDSEQSYIVNKKTGEMNMLREEDGNYMLDLDSSTWIQC